MCGILLMCSVQESRSGTQLGIELNLNLYWQSKTLKDDVLLVCNKKLCFEKEDPPQNLCSVAYVYNECVFAKAKARSEILVQ